MMKTKPIKRIVEGVRYYSEAKLCEAYGIEVATFRYRLKVKKLEILQALTDPLTPEERARQAPQGFCPACVMPCTREGPTLLVNEEKVYFCSISCLEFYTSDSSIVEMLARGEPLGTKNFKKKKKHKKRNYGY